MKSPSRTPAGIPHSISDSTPDPLATDAVIVRDRAGRRRFIRNGTAFILAGGAGVLHRGVLANECDRPPGEKNPEHPGSDSDTGSAADPQGCGRQQDDAQITRRRFPEKMAGRTVEVGRITASGRKTL